MMAQTGTNPFFGEWNTPFQTPPFDQIKLEHYLPAFEEGMKLQKAAVDAIVNSADDPTFENTIHALETSSEFLDRVENVFFALNSSNTNEEMQSLARKLTPMLSKHGDDINLNPKLFERVKKIYDKRSSINLSPEEKTVLDNYYIGFVRSGSNLDEAGKEKLRKLNEEMSMLTLKFGENMLKETNAVGLALNDAQDLAGLPADMIAAAGEMARSKQMQEMYAFTLQKPSFIPFLQYAERRDLREKLFKAYLNRCNNSNEFDNKKVLSKIASLRVTRANLMGYKTHSDFVLERNMAKIPENVYKFLKEIWTPALKRASGEAAAMQEIITREGKDFKLEPWDWWYYAEKLKKEKYSLDEEMLRPYFKMENVRQGVFEVASKLYGIQFVERKDIQVYHPDVKVFEVKEADGRHLGIFYSDYFPRDGKRSGAWSSSFRGQSNMNGKFITPLVFNVGNFAKPTAEKPSLMSLDEVNTLFHEFGHALHSLFANTSYPSARWVPRDFVELPSQIMENWATEPKVLKMYARHYQTGEPMPDQIIEKLLNARHFNQGFETVEYIAASILDLDWHTLTDTSMMDVPSFEKKSLTSIGLIPQIESRYQSTNFQHIFAGGYSAGYYSYLWAAVLDADAFNAITEKDLFDKKMAQSFRANVLSGTGASDAMDAYKRFRGSEPKPDALLKKRGLN